MIMGDGIKLRLTGASHRCPLLLSAPDCPSGIFWCPVCKPLWRVCRSWSGGMSRPDEWRPVDTRRMNARLAAEELDREDQTTSATSACEFYAMCLPFFFQPYTQISHSISRQNDLFHFHAMKGAEAPVESMLGGDTCTLASSRN